MRLTQTATICLMLFISACAGPQSLTTEQTMPNASESSQAMEESSEDKSAELEDLFWQRQKEATTRYVQADVDFMTGMIGHHAQALVMSELAPKNGANRAVQRLAARIINAQKDEIALMQRWLEDRGEAVPTVHIMNGKLMVHGAGDHHMDHSNMPGMLSDEQLDELAAARDVEFDRLFLTYMIQHHQGAVIMVDDLFSVDGSGQDEASFKIASDINVDQITEIARMNRMLDGLPKTN